MHIRRALPEEAQALTELIMRSKAHWGYSQELLDLWRPELTIRSETIARDPVYCAEVDGTVAGVMHLRKLDATEALLDDLFIEPAFMGIGVGANLWLHAVTLARDYGAQTLVLDADRNARPFYEHMGATVVGWSESPGAPEWSLPRMRYELTEPPLPR